MMRHIKKKDSPATGYGSSKVGTNNSAIFVTYLQKINPVSRLSQFLDVQIGQIVQIRKVPHIDKMISLVKLVQLLATLFIC